MYDVTIIGGGPAGASCAESLAKKGFSCLLLERYGKKRYKTCAGGISFEAAQLKPVPPSIVERKIVQCRVISLSSQVKINMADKVGYTVYRTAYDQFLRDEAEVKGACIHYHEPVKRVAPAKGAVKGTGEYTSKVIVGAFGMSSSLYHQFKISTPKVIQLLQQEYRLPEEKVSKTIGDCIEIYFDSTYSPWGYSWIFPKKAGVSVGVMSLPHTGRKMERLTSFVQHRDSLKGVTPKRFNKKYTFGEIILQKPVEKTCGETFILIGDAAGLCDPITYEGIANAIKSGRIAADVIERHLEYGTSLSLYETRWKKEMYRDDIKYSQKLQNLMYGHPLSDKLVDAVVKMATEDQDIATGFKWFFTKEKPRKAMYNIIMGKKIELLKRVGLSSLRLIPRLIPWM